MLLMELCDIRILIWSNGFPLQERFIFSLSCDVLSFILFDFAFEMVHHYQDIPQLFKGKP